MDIFEKANLKIIKKGTVLLSKGEISQSSYKVVKGCLRSYVIDNAGKEHIFQFAPEDWIISDLDSFMNNKPATIFIDAIEESEVLEIRKPQLSFEEGKENKYMSAQTQKLIRNLIATNKRLISLMTHTAEERYLEFIETYPALIQRLPLKMIASYLGMTPEYLSDVRRKLAKK